MADNKSCEGRVYVCVDCSNVEVVNDIKYDGRTCEECGGHSSFAGFGGIDFASGRDLSVRMDFSESIKGLKAIQREAKKATAALKEYDNVIKHTCPECKTISLDLEILTADTHLYQTHRHCNHCGYKDVVEHV